MTSRRAFELTLYTNIYDISSSLEDDKRKCTWYLFLISKVDMTLQIANWQWEFGISLLLNVFARTKKNGKVEWRGPIIPPFWRHFKREEWVEQSTHYHSALYVPPKHEMNQGFSLLVGVKSYFYLYFIKDSSWKDVNAC